MSLHLCTHIAFATLMCPQHGNGIVGNLCPDPPIGPRCDFSIPLVSTLRPYCEANYNHSTRIKYHPNIDRATAQFASLV